jgi:hypothetical protein
VVNPFQILISNLKTDDYNILVAQVDSEMQMYGDTKYKYAIPQALQYFEFIEITNKTIRPALSPIRESREASPVELGITDRAVRRLRRGHFRLETAAV